MAYVLSHRTVFYCFGASCCEYCPVLGNRQHYFTMVYSTNLKQLLIVCADLFINSPGNWYYIFLQIPVENNGPLVVYHN